MDPAFLPSVSDTNSDTVAAFSSRGPAIDSAIKPELVAPGTAIYTATQKYDINGDMYDSTGYTVAEGTSFAAPMVAGAVALAKQKNPGFSPAQLKSAVVNTASPLIPPDGQARIASAGAGKLNVEAVVRTNVTVEPATLSFGVVTAAAIGTQRTLKIANGSSAVVTLAVEQRDPDPNARLRLGATSVAAGRTDTIAVFLEGAVPAPGSYEGVIAVKGGAVDLRVPYLYLVGDGVPYNVFPVNGAGFEGIAGQYYGSIALKAVDQYGVAVRNANVTWRVTLGGGNIPVADSFTDIYGLAFAQVNLGSNPGDQEFTATVGTGASQLVLPFQGRARALPTIDTGGVIDAANGQAPQSGRGLAPGSYISIWGQNLAEVSLDFNAVLPAGIPFYLPVSLGGASVSFDVQDQRLSVPAQLTFVSPRQVNVQVPWELTGIGQASMKVTTGGFSTTVYTVFLSDSAPAVFEAPLGSGLAAAADALTGVVVGAANPMQKGRWVSIYANGLGPVSNTPATGEMSPLSPLAQCRFTPEVTIGGKVATVNFAGLTPTGIGYYQINALVPPDAPSGNQPVTVKVNGVAAKTVNLPIQ